MRQVDIYETLTREVADGDGDIGEIHTSLSLPPRMRRTISTQAEIDYEHDTASAAPASTEYLMCC